jgi:serine/threonine protein kinase/tetratricopeptide (TPR) repeat protein
VEGTQARRARFAGFELDLHAGELRANGECTLLPEQVLQVLRLLAERQGDVVTRDELKKKLWPNDTVVEFDHGINNTVKRLRKALDDSAEEPRYIETIPRRGYRLLVPVKWIGREDSSAEESSARTSPDASKPDSASKSDYEPLTTAKVKVGQLSGKVVSHYRALEVIGGGGMGLVYRAEDLKLGRSVALKFLPEELGDDLKARERFEREAKAVSALNHINICTVHDFDEYEAHPFIAMELLQGKTLRDHLAEGRFRLTQAEGLEIAIQIASGLEAAHEKGIIHRDIKPANIFITEKNVAKILDFGVAKVLEANEPEVAAAAASEASSSTPHDRTLTRTGIKLGTAGYMSPEQVRGEPLDARTDIFSFGLVLYEMATGERAFTGETEAILHDAIQHREPRPVRDLAPEISPKLETGIRKCLEKDRDQRFQTTAEAREWLVLAHDSRPRSSRTLWLAVIAPLLAVIAIIVGMVYRHTHPKAELTHKDTIVIADFANSTGEPVFDSTLKQGLAIQLEQSPVLSVLSDRRVAETLKLMKRPSDELLTQEVAREVCLRTNSGVLVVGSISRIGEHYLVGVRAAECASGDSIASAETEAGSRDEVLKALGDTGNELRQKLGESLASVQKLSLPLEEATTSSLAALQSFSLGAKIRREKGGSAALPYLIRAVELDPNFARAYEELGMAYENSGHYDLTTQYLTKAFEMKEHVAPYDRFVIEANYYNDVIEDLPRASQIYQQWISTYPNAFSARNNLGNLYGQMGRWEESATETSASFRLMPDNGHSAINSMGAYIALDRLDEAKAVFEAARSHNVDFGELHEQRYHLAFVQKDAAAMQEQLAWAKGDSDGYWILYCQSETESYHGHLAQARILSQESELAVSRLGNQNILAFWLADEALMEAEIGDAVRARRTAERSLAVLRKTGMELFAPMVTAEVAYARSGAVPVSIRSFVSKHTQAFPSDTLLQNYWLPTMQAAVAISNRNPRQAIEALSVVDPYELSGNWRLYPIYIRGIAYLKLREGQQAAHEFQKLLNHPGIVVNQVWGALAHLQLARAQEMMGDKDAASKSYQDFLTLWKDADPDIPIYKQAKAEYAKLH